MLKIPLVPQWNLNSGCVCTPDGGFLYAGSRSINFISCVERSSETPLIQCYHTRQGILSLDVDPRWGQIESCKYDVSNEDLENNTVADKTKKCSSKLFVALLQDNSVQIWDFNKGCAIQGHKAHLAYIRYMEGNGPSPQHAGEVLISYMCNRNVLSVDSQDIVVYCVASNSFYRRPIFISPRNHQMTSLKCSPYYENHFAVGTKRGLVLLCDLQKMVILYTLRGHDTSVTSLAWNRVDITSKINSKSLNIEAAPKTQSKPGKLIRSAATIDSDDIFDIYDYEYLDNEFGVPIQRTQLKDDFVGIEKPKESSTTAKFDFAEACQSLKEEINALKEEQPETSPEHMISLEECQQMANKQKNPSSCGSEDEAEYEDKSKDVLSEKESSDGSIVRLACHTPSSEESVYVDGMHQNQKQNIICQADVHYINQDPEKEALGSDENLEAHSGERYDALIKESKSNCPNLEEAYDVLLASCSTNGTFCIWNATSGGTCDTQKVKATHGGKNTHIEISWINSTAFIINNKGGELQLWNMQPPSSNQQSVLCGVRPYKFKESKREWTQRSVVSFACSSKGLLWTISSHREICMDDFRLNKILLNYSCVSTSVSAIEECPDDMNKIALGFSDRRIGIIDISKMTPTSVHIENFVQRIESSVMSLVWSPDCKKLAYGTIEGRIGVFNVEGSSRQPYTYNSVCGKPIYSIIWQDTFLYVVCNDCIAVYEDDPNKKDPYIIPGITNVSCISLRNNYLFVGTQNGQLKLYTRAHNTTHLLYELKLSLDLVSRYITKICWSPIATNKLAVVANANIIHVLEFDSKTADLQIMRKIKINSSKAANGSVKWSNRNENVFLTCGFDGAVRVWDLSNEKNPEHFIKTYHCPMTCGLFLPTDEEIIVCSGKSAALEFIDMRKEKSESSTGKSKRSNPKTLDTVQWATKAVTGNDGKSQTVDKKLSRLAKIGENNANDALEDNIGTRCEKDNELAAGEEVSAMMEQLHLQKKKVGANNGSIYLKNPATLMYLTAKEINKDATELMLSILSTQKPKDNKSLSAKLFGTKAEAKEVLAEEVKNHDKSEVKGISSLLMPQLNNSFKEEILKRVQSKQLSEWHVSLAPSISYSFWQKCCEAYAEQLLEQGNVLQAAAYILAIHKHQAAIEMLMEKKYFKEASLIARIYLQREDPLNNTISEQWITHLNTNGNLVGAALLCLLTKQNNRAHEYLTKIRNTSPEIERIIRLLKSADM